jgi:hypothetical protein
MEWPSNWPNSAGGANFSSNSHAICTHPIRCACHKAQMPSPEASQKAARELHTSKSFANRGRTLVIVSGPTCDNRVLRCSAKV